MITLSDILIKYGDRVLLDHINFVIAGKDKIGLVGRNGTGKTTLLKIIAGEISPDYGKVAKPVGCTLGFLRQEMNIPMGKTIIEETLTAFEESKQLIGRIHQIEKRISQRTDYESVEYNKLLNEFTELNDRFNHLGGKTIQAKAEKILKGLGFKNSDFDRLTQEFSGGWKMRIELAKMLLKHPDYLLLDEPTNHLDIESIIWLEAFLKDYSGAVVVISHDKTFLNQVSNRTIEIEVGNIFDYKKPYSKAMEMRAERRGKTLSAFQNQQKVIAQKERTITRFMAKATKTKMAQSMQKQLDKMDRIKMEDEDLSTMSIQFPGAPRSGQVVIEGKRVTKNYGRLNVLKAVDFKMDRGDRVAFVGKNGQGKTTLAKIIIRQLEPTVGEIGIGHNVQIGYYAQNQPDTLPPNLTLLETMEQHSPPEMRTKLRSVLGAFLFSGEDVEKKVSVLSGGERARLALACMLLRPFNLLVLDEPTNHLDIRSKEILKRALLDFNGTLIVVSHDRDFLTGLTSRTIEFRENKLFNYLGDINYFLEKRAFENFRQVELTTKNSKTVEDSSKKMFGYEERKKLLRTIGNTEKKIEKLEIKIGDLEGRMTNPGFYDSPDYQTITDQYKQYKKEIEEAMDIWEKSHMALDEMAG